MLAELGHLNIVPIYDVGDIGGQPYFTMELIEGGSLTERIQGAPQPTRPTAEMLITLAEAVHAAHQRGATSQDFRTAAGGG